jgi:hypothetical protein
MSLNERQHLLQNYQVLLYDRALHPLQLPLRVRRVVHEPCLDFEAWVMPGEHALRFEHRSLCLTELVTNRSRAVPTAGVISARLCASEQDSEQQFPEHNVSYLSTVQAESLSATVYSSLYNELLAAGRESSALVHLWEDACGKCLSMVDVQRMHGEVRCESFHLVACASLSISTISVFELITKPVHQRVEIKPREAEPLLAPPRQEQA